MRKNRKSAPCPKALFPRRRKTAIGKAQIRLMLDGKGFFFGFKLRIKPEVGNTKYSYPLMSSRAAVCGVAIQISGLLRYARNDEPQPSQYVTSSDPCCIIFNFGIRVKTMKRESCVF
ncbi:MAG: hypothetical protein A3K09_04740 [Nitrospinae bacterium RIFCSPLOWO2_12_FULL_47_7]|nr:MAG: hypothetical protein A3K09_04740 [Nitrospinae bacterium RIFCSPLOWO2_12_FULL_47_7]